MISPSLPDLDLDLCRQRQERLRSALAAAGAGRAILSRPEHVHYLTGFRPHPLMTAAVFLDAGRCLLFAPNAAPARHAASEVIPFPAQALCTLRQDQEESIAALLRDLPSSGLTTPLALEGARAQAHYAQALGAAAPSRWIDLTPLLLRLRRCKDPDELALLRHAIAATEAMYARARDMLRPGITELAVFSELQSTAVSALGEPLTATGNDYQCNSPGGPPRVRPAEDGELFILDLGPAYRGYYADNCRTFSVGQAPTSAQRDARQVILDVFAMVEQTVRPGASCRALYQTAKAILDRHLPDSFFHHLGHGIGLYPHEAPHLNPDWNEAFEEGDVFTVEPGLYAPHLRAGIRIEEDYLVTSRGVERLTQFPTDL